MNSVCGKLDSRDADILLENSTSSPTKCSDGSKRLSFTGSEDTQESDGDDTGNIEENGDECKHNEPCSKSSLRSDSVPSKSSDEEDDGDFATALQLIFSEPTPTKLISAMKGGREKHGRSPQKLRVSWAPDVYDPPPSLVSHTRGKKQQQKSKSKDNYKKNGKKGQKGSGNSSSRGGGSKDKKQSSRSKHGREKFHVGNPDAFCGGSFLKTNPTKVHYSVAAEAL